MRKRAFEILQIRTKKRGTVTCQADPDKVGVGWISTPPPHYLNEPAQLLWRPLGSHVELSQESTKSKLNGQQKAWLFSHSAGALTALQPRLPRTCPRGAKGEIYIKTEMPQFGECSGKVGQRQMRRLRPTRLKKRSVKLGLK